MNASISFPQNYQPLLDLRQTEPAIRQEDRSVDYLKFVVYKIYDVIRRTERYISHLYPEIVPTLPDEITIFHSENLERHFPNLSPKQREKGICKGNKAVFVIGIGADLPGGKPHNGRARDYDDWSTPTRDGYKGMNGDILVYFPLLDCAYEPSSMGIRVDPPAMVHQPELRGANERRGLLFHRRLINGELPLSIGGRIGQSRLCMFFLRKAHIGEILSSLWPDEMVKACRAHNITLL